MLVHRSCLYTGLVCQVIVCCLLCTNRALHVGMTSTLAREFGQQLSDLTLSCGHSAAQAQVESDSPLDDCFLAQC